MYNDLTHDQKMLADFMSELSERCYSAGWMHNLEYVLWDAVINGEREYGHDVIGREDVDNLTALSKLADSWVYFDNDTEETAIPIDQWREKIKNDIEINPGRIIEGFTTAKPPLFMFKTIRADYKNLSKEKFYSKYVAYSFLVVLIILLCGQLIAQLYTTNQLHKVTGTSIKKERGPAYYTRGRGRVMNKNYAYLITLNSGITYTINLEGNVYSISESLKPGGNVTIYTPTGLYNVLSLSALSGRGCVSQFEYNGDILYSFDHQKRRDVSFIWYLVGAILVFCYVIYRSDFYNSP